jgi:hypothetical protein
MKLYYFIIILLILLDISIPLFTYDYSCDKCIITYNSKTPSGLKQEYKLAIEDIYNDYKLGHCLIKFNEEGYKIRNVSLLK